MNLAEPRINNSVYFYNRHVWYGIRANKNIVHFQPSQTDDAVVVIGVLILPT